MPSFPGLGCILRKEDPLSVTVRKPEKARIKLTVPLLRIFSTNFFKKRAKLNNSC